MISNIIREITNNRRYPGDFEAAIERHNKLRSKLDKAITRERERLTLLAFGDIEPDPEAKNHPLNAIRAAVKSEDKTRIKATARAAYEAGYYTTMELAGILDPSIAALLDFEYCYGPAASLNQQLFLKFALEAPRQPSLKRELEI